jgi:hypothetical protein
MLMPGFTPIVQGLEVLFKFLEGILTTAYPMRVVSIKNVLPGLARRTEILTRGMCVIGSGDDRLPLPIFLFNCAVLRSP